jgi:predicted RecA/RadA family phage recombinase
MKTFIQNGDLITVTAPPGGIASGAGIIVGSLFGVAAFTAAEGGSIEIATTGVYEQPKDSLAVIAVSDRVSWDDTAKQIKLPAVGLYPVGIATEAAGSGGATVKVRLDGVATAAA